MSVLVSHPQCLKYKTHSSLFLNRFEALNLSLMEKMQNRQPPPVAATSDVEMLGEGGRAGTPQLGGSVTPVPGGTAGGGVKKKKGKKKK